MSPGSITELIGDDTPVMRVTFPERQPPKNALYWRGPVLWRFDGVTWRSNNFASTGQSLGRLIGPQRGAGNDLRYQVMMEPNDRRWLFTLDLASGFPADSSRTIEGIVERDRPVTSLYPFEAWAALGQPVPLWAAPAVQRENGLRLPANLNPRTAALARSWRAAIGDDPMALAERAMTYIRSENFGYSLSPPPLVGAHRMDEFLFETRLGFCEHYAAAFVVLMRGAGVPARVVTGYLGGDFNRVGGYWIVRNSDAHAWVEILVEGRGWIRADPTAAIAPERVEQSGSTFAGQNVGGDIEWLRSLRERADAARAWWNNTVVRFDNLQQQDFFANIGVDPDDWRQLAGWMGGGLAVLGLLAALVFYLQQRREPEDAARRIYRRFLKDLGRRGVHAGASEGPIDLAQRAAIALPQLANAILTFTRAYEDARYGIPVDASLSRLQRALREFRSASRQA
jgi:transglutaminase-like putative cysteine protease